MDVSTNVATELPAFRRTTTRLSRSSPEGSEDLSHNQDSGALDQMTHTSQQHNLKCNQKLKSKLSHSSPSWISEISSIGNQNQFKAFIDSLKFFLFFSFLYCFRIIYFIYYGNMWNFHFMCFHLIISPFLIYSFNNKFLLIWCFISTFFLLIFLSEWKNISLLFSRLSVIKYYLYKLPTLRIIYKFWIICS